MYPEICGATTSSAVMNTLCTISTMLPMFAETLSSVLSVMPNFTVGYIVTKSFPRINGVSPSKDALM